MDPDASALSAMKLSESGLHVSLHPLPVLEISDHIARVSELGHKGAIVGALLGRQDGREVSVEHSFACMTSQGEDGFHRLNPDFFRTRLNQMKQVLNQPQMELVGWYSLVPATGPTSNHVRMHTEINMENDNLVLLGFHLDQLLDMGNEIAAGLPITLYEAENEADGDKSKAEAPGGEDLEMSDGHHAALKFRELPYATDTVEVEMIAMQFIREGGANASLESVVKGKQPAATADEDKKLGQDANLTKEESEDLSVLQSKANAVRMMKARIELIVSYLQSLPPEFLAGHMATSQATQAVAASDGELVSPSHRLLRQIQALVTNLGLATPAESKTLAAEIQQETNDVELLSMITALVASVEEVRDLGKKFSIVEAARNQKSRYQNSSDSSSFGASSYSAADAGDLMR